MSGNRDRYNQKKTGSEKPPMEHDIGYHETMYEARKREQAEKSVQQQKKKESHKQHFATIKANSAAKVEGAAKGKGRKDAAKKEKPLSARDSFAHQKTEKAGKKQGTPRQASAIIGFVACLMLVFGIVLAFQPFGNSEVKANTTDLIKSMPSVTGVYDEGLVSMGEATQEEMDAKAAKGVVAQIPPKEKEYDPIVYSYPAAGKRVALTFDDGPAPKTIDNYLKILADNNVKASFFMLGNSVKAYPEEAKKVEAAGHDVVSHSLQHSQLSKLDEASLRSDFEQTNAIFKEVLGHTPKYMRPPYGDYNDLVLSVAKEYGEVPIYWSIDTNDWRGNSTETMVNTVTSNLSDGAIILMHEGKDNTLAALPAIIQAVKDAGYDIVPLSELLSY